VTFGQARAPKPCTPVWCSVMPLISLHARTRLRLSTGLVAQTSTSGPATAASGAPTTSSAVDAPTTVVAAAGSRSSSAPSGSSVTARTTSPDSNEPRCLLRLSP
jgi:hypothetical protein